MASEEHKTRLTEAAKRLKRVSEEVSYLAAEYDGMNEEAGEQFSRELNFNCPNAKVCE